VALSIWVRLVRIDAEEPERNRTTNQNE